MEEIPVVLGVGVEVGKEDLHDWGRVDWAAVSVACATGPCCNGLLSDVEMVSGLGGWSSWWWRG